MSKHSSSSTSSSTSLSSRPHSARRRSLLQFLPLAGLTCALGTAQAAAPTGMARRPEVKVWKDPQCGCCQDWIEHMQANGFAVRVQVGTNTAARARLGMPTALGSCHTALVEGYVLEGHVPAADVHLLLQQKLPALGLTVPGMPIGSPGMDGPAYGGRRDAYEVLLVAKNGSTRTFSRHAAVAGKTR